MNLINCIEEGNFYFVLLHFPLFIIFMQLLNGSLWFLLPVKNVTWILMKIPCHFMSRIDGSLVKIHTKFNYNSLFSMLQHDMDFG